MLKDIPHVDGCLENEKRIIALEAIVFQADGIEVAKALSKGAIAGAVDLMSELVDCKDMNGNRYEKLLIELNTMKAKINEVIQYVKSRA